jgi:MFS family permease
MRTLMISTRHPYVLSHQLPILASRLTSSALLTAGLAALEAIPYLLFGLFAGAIADRVDRRRLMVVSDALNLLLLGSITVAARLGVLTIAHIYAVGLLSASAYVWFDTANFGALQRVVGRPLAPRPAQSQLHSPQADSRTPGVDALPQTFGAGAHPSDHSLAGQTNSG